jgi:hypothetical protein
MTECKWNGTQPMNCEQKESCQVDPTILCLSSLRSSSTHRYSLASSAYFSLYSMREALLMVNKGRRNNKRQNGKSQCQCNKVGVVVGTVVNICVSRFEFNVHMSGCFMFEGFLRSAIYVGQAVNV